MVPRKKPRKPSPEVHSPKGDITGGELREVGMNVATLGAVVLGVYGVQLVADQWNVAFSETHTLWADFISVLLFTAASTGRKYLQDNTTNKSRW